ncbi:hypothetical protein [Listeria booriae]|uniref:Uncharacterized protein n=1 Tax=Listeria booriae TaxID=1552123 RepID=A0A841ZUF5_9LIST|nr:hypothetical protein [Listeria booriae]MBC1565075.1 hypothetical protein [Listeria booriae]
MNHDGHLLFMNIEYFLEDYEIELKSLGFEGKFLSFMVQQEKPYIKQLFDSLMESYNRGIDAFYRHESKIEQLAFQCVEYRLLGYMARFEQEKNTV